MIRQVKSGRRDWWIVAAWLGSLAAVRSGTVAERDPYWQVRAGLENLTGQPLSRPDTWSWAPVDAPFTQTSPGWNTLLAVAWRYCGFAGIFVVSLVSISVYFLVVALLARRLGSRPIPTLVGILVCTVPALAMLSPRATVMAQTIFLFGVLMADRWRRRTLRPGRWLDPVAVALGALLVTMVGSWVHLSWLLLAPATVVCWGALWFSGPAITSARSWALTAATLCGAAGGVLAGPYGTDAWALSQQVRDACSGLVTEWLGVMTPGLAVRWALPALLALTLATATAIWVGRRWRQRGEDTRVGLLAALTLIALPASVAAFSAIRFVGVALLTLAPAAALGCTLVWDRVRARAQESPPRGVFTSPRIRFWSDGAHYRPVLIAVVALLAPGVLLLAAPLSRPLPELAVLDFLPKGCRLVSDPSSAAPVLLLRPDVQVWFDGRFDYWGRDRMVEAAQALASDRLEGPPWKDTTCVVLSTQDQFAGGALAKALDSSTDWASVGPNGTVRAWVRSQ
jgi:hypothetical protein